VGVIALPQTLAVIKGRVVREEKERVGNSREREEEEGREGREG